MTVKKLNLFLLSLVIALGRISAMAGDAPANLLTSFLRKADESTIGHILVAITVL